MISLINKTTKNLRKTEINEICKLKNFEWKYGFNSQKSWFKKNIKLKDFHNILLIKKKIYGYTCLRKRTYRIDKKNYKNLLFDTLIVNSSLRKNGFGKLIMIFNNYIIKKNKLPSFLVCRKKTLNFYKDNNWRQLKNKNFKIMDQKFPNQYGMMFNEKLFKKRNKLLLWTKK